MVLFCYNRNKGGGFFVFLSLVKIQKKQNVFMKSHSSYYVFEVASISKELVLFCGNAGRNGGVTHILKSSNGVDFFPTREKMLFKKIFGIAGRNKYIQEPFRISQVGRRYFLVYKKEAALGHYRLTVAISENGLAWENLGQFEDMKGSGVAVRLASRSYLMLFGEQSVRMAVSSDMKQWKVEHPPLLQAREWFFDSAKLVPGNIVVAGKSVILVYAARDKHKKWYLGAAAFDKHDIRKVLWRTDVPLWEQPEEWKGKKVAFVGTVDFQGKILAYWNVAGRIMMEELPQFWKHTKKKDETTELVSSHPVLERHPQNPIIVPRAEYYWESYETFNPAAFTTEDGRIHILYRAIGDNGISTVGYAVSEDGVTISERLPDPIYVPRESFEGARVTKCSPGLNYDYFSGGGCGGCEDPRITLLGDMLYMVYVAFDGYTPPRLALTSISLQDFLDRKWNWKRPVLISPPGVVDKSGCIFPEKINGKFVVFHRIFPNILIDFADSLEAFDGQTFLKGEHKIGPRPGFWDQGKLSIGAPPLKTDRGWLVIYHATSALAEQNGGDARYKIGAMLLDLKDPTKVLARSKKAILEPEEWYENHGHKWGVVYPCGAAIKNGQLFVYYGGSDMVVCVATAPLEEFLDTLIDSSKPSVFRHVSLR
jgi:predicted GH43/DUF377 family glycosyl hydrolase